MKGRGSILRASILALALGAVSVAAPAAVVWNEAVDGDLSGNGLSPSTLVFGLGSNEVLGSTGNPGTGVDRDYFSFVVPDGMMLTDIILLPNTFVSGGASFLGMQAGPQLTVTPSGSGAENLIGFVHYDNSMIGINLLPAISAAGNLGPGA